MKIAGSGFRIQDPDPRSISQRHGSEDPPDPDPPQNVMDPQHCYLILWCGSGTSLLLWCGSGSWFSFDADPDPDFHLTWMRIRLFTWYGSGSYFFLQSWIRPKWFSNLSLWLDMDPWHFGVYPDPNICNKFRNWSKNMKWEKYYLRTHFFFLDGFSQFLHLPHDWAVQNGQWSILQTTRLLKINSKKRRISKEIWWEE
jgi:hypothetical protein